MIPCKHICLQGIVVSDFHVNKYSVHDDKYNYHDSLQVHFVEGTGHRLEDLKQD